MSGKMKGLEESWKERTTETRNKASNAIAELQALGKAVNFNSVHKAGGVSKSFLYEDTEIREQIEMLRKKGISKEINQRAKFDKTSQSKDRIIAAKDKRIAKLEEENRKLKSENELLRGRLYDMN